MIRPPTVSRETLLKFANEFYQRKMARQRKKREERKLERKIEKSLTMDTFGRGELYDLKYSLFIRVFYLLLSIYYIIYRFQFNLVQNKVGLT